MGIRAYSVVVLFLVTINSQAGVISSVFDSRWVQASASAEDDLGHVNKVSPGYGGQAFDAEYLFYKMEGSTLSIGLQAGYDIVNGVYDHTDGRRYYSGDLALSFDGVGVPGTNNYASTFEYAVDFGFETRGYRTGNTIDADNNGDGIDLAGLYQVEQWNNDVYFDGVATTANSTPYAMDEGRFINTGFSQSSGSETYSEGDEVKPGIWTNTSFYRIVSFDIGFLGLNQGEMFDLDMHWTMSCGNDAIDGGDHVIAVSEPSSLVLIGVGIIGLSLLRKAVKDVSLVSGV